MNNPKTFTIITFGCQMNKSDSELMEVSLLREGFIKSDTVADIIIFNTCSVRKHAEERALAHISQARTKYSKALIVVAGCMAQRLSHKLRETYGVDLIIGPYLVPKIGKILKHYLSTFSNYIYTSQERSDFASRIDYDLLYHKDDLPWHKWVTISHGCDNYCSYCIVPYVRGKLISFPSRDIIEYCRMLTENGITEITLLGQNVNQYGHDTGDIPFYKLLEHVATLPGLQKVNFLTSHPKDFTNDIIYVIRDYPNIARSIHLPLQSGSDTILKAMNRNYTMKHYYTIIESIRKILPQCALSTDIIVGFPGETSKDFEETMRAITSIEFDEAFTYKYSPREGTQAYYLEDTVPEPIKQERLDTLIKTVRTISHKKLKNHIHTTTEMIVERISKKSSQEVMGKTMFNHPVVIKGNSNDIGKKYTISIVSVKGSTLYGERIA